MVNVAAEVGKGMRYLHLYRLLTGLLPAPDWKVPDDMGELGRRFAGIYCKHRALGSALGLFDYDGLKTHLCFGEARRGVLVAEDTAFRVASVSKMVTGALVMKLAEAGQIDLDGDVDSVLPYSLRHPGAPDVPITLRMLLTHVAGINDGKAYIDSLGQDVPAQKLLAQDSHTAHLPGVGCEYSNFGVGLVACVLEAALGRSFEVLAQEWLFEPLNMNASFYPHRVEATLADAWRILPPGKGPACDGNVRQKTVKAGWDEPDPYTHYSLAQGNCCMDIKSAVNLGQALMRPGFFQQESLDAMRTPVASLAFRDPALTQGIGTFVLSDPAISPRPLYGHQGMAYGAVHMMFMDPETGEGIISFTSGVSEARRYILADVNRALISAWQEAR